MLVVHANWTAGGFRLWAESLDAYLEGAPVEVTAVRATSGGSAAAACGTALAVATRASDASTAGPHPFAVSAAHLRDRLIAEQVLSADRIEGGGSSITLRLPADEGGPCPSDRLASVVGETDDRPNPSLDSYRVPAIALEPGAALESMLGLDRLSADAGLEAAHSLRYWTAVSGFVLDLLADQRFIATLFRDRHRGLRGAWQPWLHDDVVRAQVGVLLQAMPPVVRAVVDDSQARPWPILDEALRALTDATVRRWLVEEAFEEAIEERDPAGDPHVAWLAGLLGSSDAVNAPDGLGSDMLRDAGHWVRRLDETGHDHSLRLCLCLQEPLLAPPDTDAPSAPTDETRWPLTLCLQSADQTESRIPAEQIWATTSAAKEHRGHAHLQELLLTELGRASRIYPMIERALSDAAPHEIELTTVEAYEFLRETRPVLEEAGFGVVVPEWWGRSSSTLGARLQIEAPGLDGARSEDGGDAGGGRRSAVGLDSLVEYQWQIAIGEQPLTMEEFEALSRQRAPLVRVRDRWVELRTDQVAAAASFIKESPRGTMTVFDAIQVAYGAEPTQFGLPIFGLDATGWVAELLHASEASAELPRHSQPEGFAGTLRPYQLTGLNWLAFLDQFGLGACLADDMGLGKTIQLIALLVLEREQAMDAPVGPTLLIVPTSLIGNWTRELGRFAPGLSAHVHHGPQRPTGSEFLEAIDGKDVVITTYGLVTRDCDSLREVDWHRVALDEAQYIKNPPTKQTGAIRSLRAARRLALTGTPVENRLSELWSIMQFCNPGYLGQVAEFRRRFAVPIERHRDAEQAERLRQLVRPFVLRRLKTDSTVIDDLPACVQTKEFATLTPEQATLYENVVNGMLTQVDQADGMQRRGLVLATLVKLKQICNHPAQFLGELAESGEQREKALPVLSSRSGKARRLVAMLEEVLATGERALIFTQFRQMGHLLQAMIKHDLDIDALFMHGGTPQAKRQKMIDRFQDPQGDSPIFVLSLKAGGVGLNLTAANHVFHADRWWNPAVENQATDRAFRIGQMRTVHVHKFVCVGTLEERIDQMIEQKMQLAENIIGSGEGWLTELSTSQLQEILTLRESAMEAEA